MINDDQRIEQVQFSASHLSRMARREHGEEGAGVRSGGQDERRDQNGASTTVSSILVGACKHAVRA